MSTSLPPSAVGRLHVITDFRLQQRFSHADLAVRAIAGGADTIQFREKHGGIRNQLIAAERVQSVCETSDVPLIVNDRLDVALGVRARGLHVGQEDIPVAMARRVLGPAPVLGASASTIAQAQQAEAAGATYIGFGPIYPTRSKANAGATQGLDRLRDCCDAVTCPVIAIGGITHRHVEAVLDAGAYGIAVLSAVATAANPRRATRRLRLAIDEAL
ncbi:thiamine phosphate synthase [Longimonas halophila]|uniref:Thiamine-phosphate synthase n=1 Tax=Longimonas halophila TaxID=1469170 RepID=A0A2H3NX16_9BACT|nr:thiamine phosphate synthase [Longimonas halophila]PEN09484.1 thiamine phosphate synthase [Longimonas halophila]